ncbi:MAG: twin-arginine translocation signal domain-containing protein, partial [Caldilineaceae bacterium]|nr:twin-arginine translocation signal domain-containing protein [Caldilineaceae bacterium]
MYTPTHQPKRTLSRRRFLQLSAVAGTGLLGTLAAMLPRVSAVPQALAGTIPGPTYSEAPMLADLVTRGQLPPVDQRLPTVPGVIPTIESAGKYGDRIRRLHRGRADRFGLTKIIDHGLAWFDHDLTMRPHIAEAWEVNADATVWTFMLRAGMKWSDGEPFTTADIHWWYDNELTNVEITPNPPERFTTGDTLMQIEVIDAQTVKFRFADPYPLFVQRIARLDNAIYAPSHYLAHFHMATTADQTALQQEYEQAGFTNWVDYYNDRNTWYLNPAKPSLAPWLAK